MTDQQIKVLIVDDEPDILEFLHYNLSRNGFDTVQASNGREAIRLADQEVPDLILLDIMMPKMDGYEVCQKIRSDALLKDVSIVMLTAKGREVEREKGLALGADHYITKPFSTRQVVMKVKEILAERSGR
jgi:DNA-binding response OmpR family regulator